MQIKTRAPVRFWLTNPSVAIYSMGERWRGGWWLTRRTDKSVRLQAGGNSPDEVIAERKTFTHPAGPKRVSWSTTYCNSSLSLLQFIHKLITSHFWSVSFKLSGNISCYYIAKNANYSSVLNTQHPHIIILHLAEAVGVRGAIFHI